MTISKTRTFSGKRFYKSKTKNFEVKVIGSCKFNSIYKTKHSRIAQRKCRSMQALKSL